jgi:DNA (cytosine-5)-methyltransferase 1
MDLSDPDFSSLDKQLKDVDVVIGGPPCQGFSLTGKRILEDPRNSLYKSMVRFVERYKPKICILENVRGLLTLYNGKAKEGIIKDFESMNYTVNYKLLLASDYGVPQNRVRVVFVFVRNDINKEYKYPEKHKKVVTAGEAISDLPSLEDDIGSEVSEYSFPPETKYQREMRKGSSKLHNHVGTRHTDYVKNVISQVPEGGNHKDLPEGVGESRNFNEAWTRYDRNKPSRTIDTGHRNHFHYKYNRVPTVRENARLQSFRDDFVFLGSKTSQYRQVGNAVPPILGYEIGKSILRILKDE